MKPDEYTEDKPKNHFEWGYLYKVYLVILIAVFLLALANQANAGVFLEIGSNMEYVDSQLPVSDIINDSDTWDAVSNYMNDVHGVPFPSYSDATAMDDLLENVLMFYVGQYCNLSGTAAQSVYDACMDVTDAASQVWDLLTLDLESGDIIRNPNYSDSDLSGVIHSVVDPLIYDEPSADVVGSWVLSNNSLQRGVYRTIDPTSQLSSFRLRNLNWGEISTDFYITVIGSADASASSNRVLISSTVPGIIYFYLNGTYQDYVYMQSTYVVDGVTYYYCSVGSNYATGYPNYMSSFGHNTYPKYGSNSEALQDLWGNDHPSEPYLNGDGYIINDNPTYSPLSGYSALNYPYRTKIVENHTNTTDPDDPVTYPVGVNTVEPATVYTDVPTWLVDPSVDIPEEPDYLENVDVELPEIEPDTGFITDVYNALPSGIVSMIAVGLGLGVVMKIIS